MGMCQGNGLGPTLWCLISTILFHMIQKAGHGVSMVSALSLSLIQLVGFAFVDDTDHFCTDKTAMTSGETLSTDFQAALYRCIQVDWCWEQTEVLQVARSLHLFPVQHSFRKGFTRSTLHRSPSGPVCKNKDPGDL